MSPVQSWMTRYGSSRIFNTSSAAVTMLSSSSQLVSGVTNLISSTLLN